MATFWKDPVKKMAVAGKGAMPHTSKKIKIFP
jgi:hypothetical protein